MDNLPTLMYPVSMRIGKRPPAHYKLIGEVLDAENSLWDVYSYNKPYLSKSGEVKPSLSTYLKLVKQTLDKRKAGYWLTLTYKGAFMENKEYIDFYKTRSTLNKNLALLLGAAYKTPTGEIVPYYDLLDDRGSRITFNEDTPY